MNSILFAALIRLTSVSLNSNVCINGDFSDSRKIAILQKTVNEKCSFDEPEVIIETVTNQTNVTNALLEAKFKTLKIQFNETETKLRNEIQLLKSQLQAAQNDSFQLKTTTVEIEICNQSLKEKSEEFQKAEALLHQTNGKFENKLEVMRVKLEGIEECKLTVAELKTEKAELKVEVAAKRSEIKEEKLQCSKQVDFFREFHQKLETQWNTTCIAQTNELRNILQAKQEENTKMSDKLQQKAEEIINLRNEIQELKKKLEIFGQF